MLATYLGQLSDARHSLQGTDAETVKATMKASALLFGTTYVGASDLLSNPALFLLLSDHDPDGIGALLKSTAANGYSPALQPVMTNAISFETLAESLIKDGTRSRLGQSQLREAARQIDACSPKVKVIEAGFRKVYCEQLRDNAELLASNVSMFPQYTDSAVALLKWIEERTDEERADFRQTKVWSFIDELQLPNAWANDFMLLSDNMYQSAFAQSVDAVFSYQPKEQASIVNLVGFPRRRAKPVENKALLAPDSVEELVTEFPLSAIQALSFAEIAELAASEPFIELRQAIFMFRAGDEASGIKFRKLFDACVEPMVNLAGKKRGERRKILNDMLLDRRKASLEGTIRLVSQAGLLVALCVTDNYDANFWLATSAFFLSGAKLSVSRSEDARKTPTEHSVQVAKAYNAILERR